VKSDPAATGSFGVLPEINPRPVGPSPVVPSSPKPDEDIMATDTDEIFPHIERWKTGGQGVALATVVQTWGSSPRPEGSHLAVNDRGEFVGSVSGGCIEGAVVTEALATIKDGSPRTLEFGVSDEQAWEVGLACGGKVRVFVERVE
jgi:xanthine/CO dehydrogenase XdhC/CoxF family maturation factor